MEKAIRKIMAAGLVSGAVFAAGPAAAKISIGVGLTGYTPRHTAWGQASRPSVDRLSEAADKLAEASGSGNDASAEAMLSGLFAGGAKRPAAEPVVYAAVLPAPAAAPVAAARPAMPELSKTFKMPELSSRSIAEDELVLADEEVKVPDAVEASEAGENFSGSDEPAAPKTGGGLSSWLFLLAVLLILL